MKIYELKKFSAESKTYPGDFFGYGVENDTDPVSLGKFNTLEEAMEAGAAYVGKGSVREMRGTVGTYYIVTAYGIEEYEANDEGDFLTSSDYTPL